MLSSQAAFIFFACLNFNQSSDIFVFIAMFFNFSNICLPSSCVKHGDILFLILFFLVGACFSTTLRNKVFHASHIDLGPPFLILSQESFRKSFLYFSGFKLLKFLVTKTLCALFVACVAVGLFVSNSGFNRLRISARYFVSNSAESRSCYVIMGHYVVLFTLVT